MNFWYRPYFTVTREEGSSVAMTTPITSSWWTIATKEAQPLVTFTGAAFPKAIQEVYHICPIFWRTGYRGNSAVRIPAIFQARATFIVKEGPLVTAGTIYHQNQVSAHLWQLPEYKNYLLLFKILLDVKLIKVPCILRNKSFWKWFI